MLVNFKRKAALAVLIFLAFGSTMNLSASALTAELAKKCAALTAQAFPPREPRNPAAGSVKGTGSDQQNYFKKCVAGGGLNLN